MNKDCEIVRDLMSLYVDDVCSEGSRVLVDEHLKECSECADYLKLMKSDSVEKDLTKEKTEVIEYQKKGFKKRSVIAGSIISGILLVPVIVCLIVNIAAGHALDWFFIVLTSLMLVGTVTVVPVLAPDNKFLWMIGSFTVCLELLLGVCCLYSGGRWFFVAGSAVLFGLSVAFLPAVTRKKPVRERLGGKRVLFIMTVNSILLILMLAAIGIHSGKAGYWRTMIADTACPLVYIWGLVLTIKYAKPNALAKTGSAFIWTGITVYFWDTLMKIISGGKLSFHQFSFLVWNYDTIYSNIVVLIAATLAAIGVIMMIAGIIYRKRGKK